MPERKQKRFWRKCRIAFRRFRIGVLFMILALVGGLAYLNQVGPPGFVKKPLLEKLRARGLDLQFTRLRWRWERGLVAENVHFGRVDDPASPRLDLKEVQVRLDYRALARLQVQVNSLVLRGGELVWPIAVSNEPPRELSVEKIQTELRLLPGDLWELDNFQARFAGANFQLTGFVTNATAVRDWKILQARPLAPGGATERRLRQLADTLNRIHFASAPQLKADVRGDARDWSSFAARLVLRAPDADTPWGSVQRGELSVQLFPAASNELSHATIALQADNARTPWAAATNLTLTVHLFSAVRGANVVHADLDLTAARLETRWGQAGAARFTADWIHAITNVVPLSGRSRLQLENLRMKWGNASRLRAEGHLVDTTNAPAQLNAAWAWWTNLAPYALDGECRVAGLKSPKLDAEELTCSGHWRAPELSLTSISGRLYGGQLSADAHLNVASRELNFSCSSDFDVKRISAFLTENTRHWLAQYSWEAPPRLEARGEMTLPAWTGPQPGWRAQILPTLRLTGRFHIENGAFRGMSTLTADSDFTYSNETWRLPDLIAVRPEGRLELAHESNDRTKHYYFRIHSTMDVRAIRPLLSAEQQEGLDLLGFSQPPVIDGEVRGRWDDDQSVGVRARVAATNFTVRGESVSGFQTALEYTNRLLKFLEPRLQREARQLSATQVDVDFAADKVYVTNGFSTVDPMVVTRAIGPDVRRAIEPYRFLQPPTVHVNGIIPVRDERDADLHFDVEGGPFDWWKLKVPRIAGKVDWVGERLTLRNIQAAFYQGSSVGKGEFDFSPRGHTDFQFDFAVTDADFHSLMGDLSDKTNRLEGRLTASLNITRGNMEDWKSLQGAGKVNLRNGLIWEIPIFGILSPALDSIVPGLGSSRASEGSATFVITNGVAHSDDLEIRSPTMRLRYWGAVGLNGQVNARAQAELLRDTWVVGRVISLALWPVSKIFEYKITGTLQDPKSEPVFFLPKLMLMPFHPLRALKELSPAPPGSTTTNAPPGKP